MSTQIIEQLKTNGTIAFVPNGDSMWPFIKNHNTTVVIVLKKARLERYDVAFYLRENGSVILHRVLEVLDDGYIVCGDGQINKEMVKEQNVVGIMHGFYKGKEFVSARDAKYIKKVDKWYNKKSRNFRIRLFQFLKRRNKV